MQLSFSVAVEVYVSYLVFMTYFSVIQKINVQTEIYNHHYNINFNKQFLK